MKNSLICRCCYKQRFNVALIKILQKYVVAFSEPASIIIVQEYGKSPYLILISCLLSLRAKDSAMLPVARKLFVLAQTPEQMVLLPPETIKKIIYSIGFFNQKAKTVLSVSRELIDRFGGVVPRTMDQLLSIKGVGRKTANLVLGVAFDVPAICVDVHVHRLANRFGLVKTHAPEETEYALQRVIPKKYWIECNRLLVMWGQNERLLKNLSFAQKLQQSKTGSKKR